MTEAWKKWEGQSVEGKFPLSQYLGGSEHSAVFLTQLREPEPQKAAIKLVAAHPASAELQLSLWKLASQLSHPNLLRIFSWGRCKLEGNDLLYVVMEHADEDLSQILPQRALTPEETREMLNPVLDTLEYLHGKELVHAHLKPSNILATGDQLKLSSDGLAQQGKSAPASRKASAYDPPEAARGEWTSAGDVWCLGATLVEVLTQRLPERQSGPKGEPVVPATLPAPFLEIARGCLRVEPRRRHNIADIAERLNPSAVRARSAAAAASSIDPLSVPLSTVPPRPGSSLPPPARPVAKLQPVQPSPQPATAARPKPRSAVPLIVGVGALVLVAIFVVPRLFTHRSEAQPTPSATTATAEKPPAQPVAQPAPAPESPTPAKAKQVQQQKSARSETPSSTPESVPQPAKPQAQESLKATSEKEKSPAAEDSTAPPPPSVAPEKKSTAGLTHTKGEVLDQILPDVSEKARASIQGKVRVTVRVHVDPSGSVSGADLDSPGPSKYFADLALQAARRWAFTSPEVDGHSVPSEWLLRFEFSQKDTKVTPSQVGP